MMQKSTQQQCSRILAEHAGHVMSTKLHALHNTNDTSGMKCPKCSQIMVKCSNQSLRELQTQNGETEFGGKSTFMCQKCKAGFSSDELAIRQLDSLMNMRALDDGNENLLLKNTLWTRRKTRSRCQVCMEVHLMKECIDEMQNGIIKHQSLQHKNSCFVTNVLRNLHKQDHVKSCFKKDKECRMKLPCKEAVASNVLFEEKEIDWHSWKGEKATRKLFVCEHQRHHADCFVNIHNEVASMVFQCNTNVVANTDGGSMMHVTNHVSKNTNKEDTSECAKAAKRMLEKLKEVHKDCNESESNVETCKSGLRALMGAVILSTRSHIVSSTLASHLVRNNGTCFHFSHDCEFLMLDAFDSTTDKIDAFLTSRKEKNSFVPFMASKSTDHLKRPKELEDTCVRLFHSKHNTTKNRMNKKTVLMDLSKDHIASNHLKLRHRNKMAVPMISHLDFQDSRSFGGICIDGDEVSNLDEDDERIMSMEKHARTALLLCVPFRNANSSQTFAKAERNVEEENI